MQQPILLIVSRQPCMAAALHQCLDLLLPRGDLTHRIEHVGFSSSVELFRRLDDFEPKALLDTMVLFDLGAEIGDPWNVEGMRDEHGLAAQLVLLYPEVYFVFLGASGMLKQPRFVNSEPKWWPVARRHHFVLGGNLLKVLTLVQLHARGFRTVFDATGLRSLLKQRLPVAAGGERVRLYEPLSRSRADHAAASADEETEFVYLNGYVAYKAGLRCWLLNTEFEFLRLLGRTRRFGEPEYKAVLSDWDLVYPDHEGGELITSLLLSDEVELKKGERLVLITSYHVPAQNGLLKKQEGLRVPKPYGGIYALLTKVGRKHKNVLEEYYTAAWEKVVGPIPRSRWQKVAFRIKSWARTTVNLLTMLWWSTPLGGIPSKGDKHTAPYVRSMVASRLLARTQLLRKADPNDTISWVQVALLAGEAKEVLGPLSRTMAYEATAVQNEAEVCAELSFHGTAAQVQAEQRLEILALETARLGDFGPLVSRQGRREERVARLNCLLQTVGTLRLRFTEQEKMGAAEQCARAFAEYQRRLKPVRIHLLLQRAAEWYMDRVTRAGTSVGRLVWVSAVLIMGFAVCYYFLIGQHPRLRNEIPQRIELAGWHSLFTFLELQPGLSEVENLKSPDPDVPSNPIPPELRWDPPAWWLQSYRTVMAVEVGCAYLHLGLLISVLYRRLTKRAP